MRTLLTILAAACLSTGARAGSADDSLTAARRLAADGNRQEALRLIEWRMVDDPDDQDARTLHGIVLSWERRYDDARRDLEAVLAALPGHIDALHALVEVEVWSEHWDRVETLLQDGLTHNPLDPALLLAHARALRARHQRTEALAVFHHLAEISPGNREAKKEERELDEALHPLTAAYTHATEWFDQGQGTWREERLELRADLPAATVMARFSAARKSSLGGRQVEVDAYPRLRSGTYAYLNAGYSPDARLYPRFRLGADLFQSLGKGWEASLGMRRLHFAEDVSIYTPSLSKYCGDWMFTARWYATPASLGTSHSWQLQARRYFGGPEEYFGVRYGRGSTAVETRTVQDAEVLDSSSIALEFRRTVLRRLAFECRWGYSRETLPETSGLRHFVAESAVYYRF